MLPKCILIRPASYTGYACYMNQTNDVSCHEKNVFSPFVKIEVEPAESNTKSVHLRFYYTNKYWARDPTLGWIEASSDQPEEDTSKLSCTLFEPTLGRDDQTLHLTHVQSGGRVAVDDRDASSRVRVDIGSATDYAFALLDWDTLVKLPKRVAFKGDNGKYIKSVSYDGVPYLQFSVEDCDGACGAYEVQLSEDGYVRIRCEVSGKFWSYSDANWICCDSSDESGMDKDTLFWPVKIDDHSIALRNRGNNYFCRRISADSKTDCLHTGVPYITNEAKLVVEEVLLERKICNVRYREEDGRVFDEKPFLAGIGTAANESGTDSSMTIRVAHKDTHTYCFSNSSCLTTSVNTAIQAGTPRIVEGRVEVSDETARPLEWGKTNVEEKITEGTYTVMVAAKSRVRVNYVGTRGLCSVPFSYTQVDKSCNEGDLVSSEHIDGMFVLNLISNSTLIFHGANLSAKD